MPCSLLLQYILCTVLNTGPNRDERYEVTTGQARLLVESDGDQRVPG